MRRMLRNVKAYAFTIKLLLLLPMMNGSQQEDNSSSSSTSSSPSFDANVDTDASTCGYKEYASFKLTEEATMLRYGKIIESKIAKSRFADVNNAHGKSKGRLCFPKDPKAKPSDEPEMHCYKIANHGKHRKNDLTYVIRAYPPANKGLSKSLVDDTIRRSFQAWADVSPLNFRQIESGQADIWVAFTTAVPMGVTGQSRYPAWGGGVELNTRVNWTVDQRHGTNLRQTTTHEIGHALGLDHSQFRAAVMFPQYPPYCPPDFGLDKDDIMGIQALYGKPPPGKVKSSSEPRRASTTPRTAPNPRAVTPKAKPRKESSSDSDSTSSSESCRSSFSDSSSDSDSFTSTSDSDSSTSTSDSDSSSSPESPRGPKTTRGHDPQGGRSWRWTQNGFVYWPPVKDTKEGRDVTWVWNQGRATPHYLDGQGWFPHRRYN